MRLCCPLDLCSFISILAINRIARHLNSGDPVRRRTPWSAWLRIRDHASRYGVPHAHIVAQSTGSSPCAFRHWRLSLVSETCVTIPKHSAIPRLLGHTSGHTGHTGHSGLSIPALAACWRWPPGDAKGSLRPAIEPNRAGGWESYRPGSVARSGAGYCVVLSRRDYSACDASCSSQRALWPRFRSP